MDIWNLIGGLGIFLFGMIVFEQTIEEMGTGYLKRILQENTNTRLKSIFTGIVQTCIFQSSTIVTMMTLGFVGAGVIGLSNALGVVIGANVGTTLTPRIVSLLGFKMNIEAIALPIIGVGSLMTMICAKASTASNLGKFLVGFGFLFLGLSYMKESVELMADSLSLTEYAHLSIRGFVLIGTVMTTIMQTSTGVTIITLTALNGGIISVDMALGIVIGANMGSAISTTIVGFLSSTKTQATKKQVAFSHFLFNITTTLIVTLAYEPIKQLMYLILGPNPDPTILLALFHTTFNIILACIWAPWLKEVIRLDMWLFPRQKTDLHLAIEHINTTLPEEIIAAVQHDVGSLREKVMAYDRASLMLDESAYVHRIDQYNEIKLIEAKLLETVISYTNYTYTKKQSKTFHLLHEAIIDLLSSRKYIKDVAHHLENLKDHSLDEEIMASSYLFFQKLVKEVTDNIHERENLSPQLGLADLQGVIKSTLERLHSENDMFVGMLSTNFSRDHSEQLSIAEIIKSNHYVLLACQSLLEGYRKESEGKHNLYRHPRVTSAEKTA